MLTRYFRSASQSPERSGLPSGSLGAGAERLGLPSGLRGMPGVLRPNHWALSEAPVNNRVANSCALMGAIVSASLRREQPPLEAVLSAVAATPARCGIAFYFVV